MLILPQCPSVRLESRIESASELSVVAAVPPGNGLLTVAGFPLQTGPLEKRVFRLPSSNSLEYSPTLSVTLPCASVRPAWALHTPSQLHLTPPPKTGPVPCAAGALRN